MTLSSLTTYQVIYTTHDGTNVFRAAITSSNGKGATAIMRSRITREARQGFDRTDCRIVSVAAEGSDTAQQAYKVALEMSGAGKWLRQADYCSDPSAETDDEDWRF